ncbi:MAG: Sjogren's syndrome/scleroderma autoantigen 1 family protein [Nitrososphaera sp.]
MASSEDDTFRIKAGASLLSKGGTLTSEPCSKCKGVQVRIGEKTTCINCGNEVNTVPPTQPQVERENTTTTTARKPAVLASVTNMIEEKIVILASEIRKDDEIFVQKEKAELLERYLVILEKVKNLLL